MNHRSPSVRRMKDFFSRMPLPPWHPRADKVGPAYLSRLAEMDLAFQQKLTVINKRLPHFVLVRMQGGSGFRMAGILRSFFLEYLDRLLEHGPYSFPSSFNVVEAFLTFNNDLLVFDLREEREHLLRLQDYFDWYTAEQAIPDDPKILVDIIEEGIIYSFDVVGDIGEYTISSGGSRLAILGVSLIRHETELSIILFCGETPPYPLGKDIPSFNTTGKLAQGHEALSPHPSLSIQDRYVDGMEGFSKVILLSRFDLETRKHDVRYLNLDVGTSYIVFTDDLSTLRASVEKNALETIVTRSKEGLERYKQLFSALASLIYLPIMFVAEQKRVVDSKFVTESGALLRTSKVRKAIKELGRTALQIHRNVRCLTSANTDNLLRESARVINPPDFKFESTGFWKPLGASEIGEDKHGNPIVGKTWVERRESYSVKSPESFVIRNDPKIVVGNDPGTVYIMRSASLGNDIYKVGLTRRSTEERANQLSSPTAVPLPFEVLASWEVADCGAVEREVHTQLKPYRLNKRREFFCAALSNIIAAVERAIISIEGTS